MLEACRCAGVRRGVFVSTTSLFTRLSSRTKPIRVAAEEAIRASGLEWTILRPTMIYGTERDRNMCRLVRHLARWPVMFVAGSGSSLQQPVHVEDLARSIVASVFLREAIGREYNLSGKRPLTFNEVIDTTARALGRRVPRLHVPLRPVARVLALQEKLTSRPFLRAEQVLRLEEDKAFPHEAAASDLDFAPRDFEEGIRGEVERMRSLKLV